MPLFSGPSEPFSQIRRKGLGVTFALRPLFPLADEIGIHSCLIGQVVSNRPINLLKKEYLEILANGFWGLAPAERMNEGIKGYAGTSNVVALLMHL